MNRKDHLQWSKDRAIEYIKSGDLRGAFASFQSDMEKHEETSNHLALEMGTMLLLSNNLSTEKEMTDWIIECN